MSIAIVPVNAKESKYKLKWWDLQNDYEYNADYTYNDRKKDLIKANNDDIKENIKDIIKSLLDTYRMSYNLAKQSFYYVKENKKM